MVFFDSQKLIESILSDLDSSTRSVEIEMYIWDPDEVGKKFEDVLIRAVQRNVSVRVIVDRIGSFDWIRTRMDMLVSAGVQVRVFRPLPGVKTLLKYFQQILLPFFNVINRRDHRKVFIIDKKIAYVGSLNIMEPALKWKETTARIEDVDDIALLLDIFEHTWTWIKNATIRFVDFDFKKIISGVEKSNLIRTTQTIKLRDHYKSDYLDRIDSAEKRIWLVTPYFNPPRFLLRALFKACERGVDVRLIVPKKTDPSWFSYLTRLYYSSLIKKKLIVYEYQPGILHSKTALIDSAGIIGSGNLNYRSFYRDLELNIIVTKEDVDALEKEFIKDIEKSQEIKASQELRLWERVFGSFLMLFKTSF